MWIYNFFELRTLIYGYCRSTDSIVDYGILISNVGSDLSGKDFIINARKIIGSDVVALFLCYNIKHLNWIKNFKNAFENNFNLNN